jgi:hypothetical protein
MGLKLKVALPILTLEGTGADLDLDALKGANDRGGSRSRKSRRSRRRQSYGNSGMSCD